MPVKARRPRAGRQLCHRAKAGPGHKCVAFCRQQCELLGFPIHLGAAWNGCGPAGPIDEPLTPELVRHLAALAGVARYRLGPHTANVSTRMLAAVDELPQATSDSRPKPNFALRVRSGRPWFRYLMSRLANGDDWCC